MTRIDKLSDSSLGVVSWLVECPGFQKSVQAQLKSSFALNSS